MNPTFAVRVLLAEDNPTDALLLHQALESVRGANFSVICVESIKECVARLRDGVFDVILLDLGLPDSSGLETFLTLRERAPDTPVLVLTGLSDEDAGLKAVQQGAQDYLIKGQVDISLLGRVIRYAVERHQLQKALEEKQERARQDREVRSMSRLSEKGGTQVTSRIYASPPLRESHPEQFQDLRDRYKAALDQALERRVYKAESAASDTLREIGETLGFLRGGPREVIEIHTEGLACKVAGVTLPRAQAYFEEARITVLELMGYLAAYYRNNSVPHMKGGMP